MSDEDEQDIDRKVEPEDLPEAGGFDFEVPSPDLPSTLTVVTASLYAAFVAGMLSVAYGVTSLAASYGGVYAAVTVGGAFAAAYGYVGLRIVDELT